MNGGTLMVHPDCARKVQKEESALAEQIKAAFLYQGIDMPNFIVNQNPQANGDHEVHNTTTGCTYMPKQENCISLGTFSSCHEAVASAKVRWPQARINGCYYCSYSCHTS
jgi:hypothetical protein